MSSQQIVVRLAGIPRGKGRPRSQLRHGRDGRSFIHTHPDAKTESYEGALRLAGQAAMVGKPLLAGPLKLAMWARMPIPASWSKKKAAAALAGEIRPTGKPDVDNLVKTIDALNAVVWGDDSQIVECFVSKLYSDKPQLVVMVEPWAAPASEGLL